MGKFSPSLTTVRNQSAPTSLFDLTVRYNNTDYSYMTSSGLWADTGSLNGNVISITTVGTNDSQGANTGLTYDFSASGLPADDRIGYKTYNNARFRCIPKSSIPLGGSTTIPTPTLNFLMQGTQGTSIDNIGNRIFECLENTQEVRITDMTGVEIERFSVPGAVALEPSSIFYDIFDEIAYVTYRGKMHKWKKISGTWTELGIFWFNAAEGNGIDYIGDLVATHRNFANNSITKLTTQDRDGWYNRIYAIPTSTNLDQEGVIFDPRDRTVWFNSDQHFHGGVTNGNRLWRLDPLNVFRKETNSPGDIRFDKWKLAENSTLQGQYNRQSIKGYDFSLSVIYDFQAFTVQQSAASWTSSNSAYDIEWRGSATAPTTSPIAASHLDYYDANGSNDGWGSTVPGAWQSTPTTDRYMQCRIRTRQFVAVTTWTPANLGNKLKLLFVMNSPDGIYYDSSSSNRVELAVNKYNPQNNFAYNVSAGTGSIPTFNSGSGYVTKTGTQYWTLGNPAAILKDTQGELNYVMRSANGTDTNQVIAMAGSNPSSNNGICRMGHGRSTDTFAHAHAIIVVDSAGTTSRVGFTDTDHTTFKLVSLNSNGSTNAGFLNKVSQTMTAQAGSNTGKWLASATGATVVDWGVWRTQSGGVNAGLADAKFLMYTNEPLTTQERSDLYDWLITQGVL